MTDGSAPAAAPARGHKSAIRNPQSAILVVLVLSAGGLCGCAQDLPERQYYILEAQRPAEPNAAEGEAILQVRPFRMDTAFSGRSLVYRVTEFRYESDYYHQFLVPPGVMLSERTRDWLASAGLFRQVVTPSSPLVPTYTLSGNVIAFYGDFAAPGQPQGILEIRFSLLGPADTPQNTLFAKTYRATSPVAGRTADAVVAALDRCLTRILADLEADFRQQLAKLEQPGS